jgi:hypothetical protein
MTNQWEETLARVEHTLDDAMTTARERELVLEEFIQSGRVAEGMPAAWQRGLEDSLQRLQALRAMAEQAGTSIATVDVALAQGEESLRQWLASTQAARTKLEVWLKGS